MKKFILASASPRRKELLEQIGLDFDILVSDADEEQIEKNLPINIYVEELALLKGAAAAESLRKLGAKNNIIISADTVVVYKDKILGKPKDKNDAFKMLEMLSGNEHEVYTGISIMRLSDGFTVADFVKTTVKFNDLTSEKINNYINTGEPMDKAGAYGIQGLGVMLVDKIDGDYSNVVGLPLSKVVKMLENDFGEKIL